uniref:Uncharacterized protein n=1 Tax=Curvibacter symbiont subsp. Hydra magnipapillata TaxID=667019 RepID=C9YBY4_CURXX|nr:hypothetical protein Csp_C22130 [Curvibacter putative symbiont of Hydra magnipapillata]
MHIRVRNDAKKDGQSVIDLSFLLGWQGIEAAGLMAESLVRMARRYSTPTPVYNARSVLQLWKLTGEQEGWDSPSPAAGSDALLRQFNTLRRTLFVAEAARGRSLKTSLNKWRGFLCAIEEAVRLKALPPISIDVPSVRAPPGKRTGLSRQEGVNGHVDERLLPRSFNRESDAFHDDLLEPVSITHADADYLNEYQTRLERAMNVVRTCAMRDFERLEMSRMDGRRRIAEASYSELAESFVRAGGTRRPTKYIDPSNGCHFFAEGGNHPNLLGNLLCIADVEMGGLPKPYDRTVSVGGKLRTETVHGGRFHWKYLEWYGKNRLMPFLGVMTSTAAVLCIVLLILEHPRLNVSSLLRAKLEDADGRSVLLSNAEVDGQVRIRLTVDKPRAGSEKSVLLTPLAQRVIERVLEWTSPVRKQMVADGRIDDARKLWVGMHAIDYRLIVMSEKTLWNGLRANPQFRSTGKKANKNRVTPFIERHPELIPWAQALTYKALRVSGGVLEYLRSGGDLVATARAFGHRNVSTTIGHYVPEALRLAVYERQIRRHQNLLLAAAVSDESSARHACDFNSTEDIHRFLGGLFAADVSVAESGGLADRINWFVCGGRIAGDSIAKSESPNKDRQLILCQDSFALATAFNYREHLRGASNFTLDRPDPGTKVAPRLWCDLVDVLRSPLPDSMHELKELVAEAEATSRRMRASFPAPVQL